MINGRLEYIIWIGGWENIIMPPKDILIEARTSASMKKPLKFYWMI